VAIDGKRPEPNADPLEALAPVDSADVEAFENEIARLLAAANAQAEGPAAVAAVTADSPAVVAATAPAIVKPGVASTAPAASAKAKNQTIRVDVDRQYPRAMEIVKKNIARLNGVFEVDSELGRGTKFTIKLPLTLAIIRALLVRVADVDPTRCSHRVPAHLCSRSTHGAR
jgi:hypothetical protein